MKNQLLGLGTAVPAESVNQSDALRMTTDLVCRDDTQKRFLRVLFSHSGVERRHTVLPWQIGYEWKQSPSGGDEQSGPSTGERMQMYEAHASELAIAAARDAVAEQQIDPRLITHLVTVSCTGFSSPGIPEYLSDALGLGSTVQRVQVGFMGCHGAINGLRVARALTAEDPRAVVLLVAVELCSIHYRMHWDAEGVKGNALFADGAAAVLLGACEQPDTGGWTLQGTGSCAIPNSRDEMSWIIGDHGFEMKLTSRVPVLIEQHLRDWMAAWLDRFGYSINDIAGWAIHPGGPRILEAAEKALGLSRELCQYSHDVLRDYGNMSSPTVLFLLNRIRQDVQGPVVLLGFGPGLTAEAALFEHTGESR
ncbi:type III polyketide synthase [Rubinisphaera margarita]|uniref:type III polyketide synthase n=1 Tax=Rubinisphaera margarita TaxID=2909586 RepID=UPI001EE7BD03|nr:type III polyketide synthase [Rubinisphaera margarita]MCG6158178.1 type III polyketide synthase [Rubinisphaera margarita]